MPDPESPVRGPYAGHEPVTTDDVARLDAALERMNGHRQHAAVALGLSPKRVDNMIQKDETLRAKWGKHERRAPAGLVAEIARDNPVGAISPHERAAAEALARQDALMQATWDRSGFNSEQRAFLANLQKSYALNLKSTIDLTYGGMIHTATRLLMLFEDIVKKIEHIDANPDEYERSHMSEFGEVVTKTAHEHRCELYDRMIAISGEFRKVNSDATKANWVRLQIQKLEGGEGDKMKRKKPGFLSVHAMPGSSVTVVEHPAAEPPEKRADEPDSEPVD